MRMQGQTTLLLLVVVVVVMLWMRMRKVVLLMVVMMMVQIEWHCEHSVLQTRRHHSAVAAVMMSGTRGAFVLYGCYTDIESGL